MVKRLKGFQFKRENILKTGCQANKNIYMIICSGIPDLIFI